MEITILVAIISAILGPLIVTKYKAYLDKKSKKELKLPIQQARLLNATLVELLDKVKIGEKVICKRHYFSIKLNEGHRYVDCRLHYYLS